ncbi:ATP/GTP-binding protein family [Actinidia rufa]|uniref:ATP/GTP-binding protein family n=1 Tax=Actinidia rufa TaxID=165716 RepID=A0A7J0DNV6_9ERIC|nr:ATP/GTP-binding protein family [Actinidia rufa]
MYSSRGGNGYGQQQPYASQSGYSQNLGSAYSGSSVGGPDGGSMSSRHLSMLGGPQESDITGYRGHPSSGAHYGGQYSSVYGSTALSSGQQVPGMSSKGAGPSALENRSGYGSAIPDSTKLTTGDYTLSSSHGYGHKSDQLFSDKISDYPSVDRYGERHSAYAGMDLQSAPTGRFGDSISFDNQHKPDLYERMDQALLLRQEQMLKAQSLQSASLDGGSRQADYIAARGPSIRHSAQDIMSYGGRLDTDPRSLSMLSASSYGGQHASSILGAAPRRNVDDLMYAQTSSNPGYGVSLPPGRDYATGKGLQDASLDLDYPRGGHSRIDERKDDRGGYARELERREERRREHLREREEDRKREKERERERERDRERKRERERERERILDRREKERDRERERGPEIRRERGPDIRRERTPPRISRDRAERLGSSLTKDVKPPRRDSPRHEALHRRHSPVKEKRREYDCKVYSSSLVDVERDYLSLDKRYPRLFISPECSKVVVNWPAENLKLPIYTPVSFEHDFVEEDGGAENKEPPAITPADEPVKFKSESAATVWNAKMILMSGLSQNAVEELSSEKSYDDRIPHFCNILRIAVLKKDNALMAIGGPWDTVDEGDPSVDDSSLVRTVLRSAKDVIQLDLKNCKHWNRFLEACTVHIIRHDEPCFAEVPRLACLLQLSTSPCYPVIMPYLGFASQLVEYGSRIHYDRVGKDGMFSHKEVTVLYVPDLADCLPSLEAWRDQWLAHKKAITEKRCQLAVKKETL